MTDFESLKNTCLESTEVSSEVIDGFLMHYAAKKERLDREMDVRFSRFRHIIKEMPSDWHSWVMAQYVSHRIFKENGLIHKYLNHAELKFLPADQKEYLLQQSKTPWRFSFSFIKDSPEVDFFEMEDVFRDESFLLYSPAVSRTLEETKPLLWFNLIGFNGDCWQTFGPVNYYNSFEPDDIFFFATEINPKIEDDDDLLDDVEKNPVPYMALFHGAHTPLTLHQNDQIVQNFTEIDFDQSEIILPEDKFIFETAEEIQRFSLKDWDTYPHYASLYFDPANQAVVLYAMTDRGYEALVTETGDAGYDFPEESYMRVNMSMSVTAGKILNKKIRLNSYEELFKEEADADDPYIDKINEVLGLALPDINEGKEPDYSGIALQTGVDEAEVRNILDQIIGHFKDKGIGGF